MYVDIFFQIFREKVSRIIVIEVNDIMVIKLFYSPLFILIIILIIILIVITILILIVIDKKEKNR